MRGGARNGGAGAVGGIGSEEEPGPLEDAGDGKAHPTVV